MSDTGQSARRILFGVACGAAIVAPLLLLGDLAASPAQDGSNHLWMIGYFGDYFRAHGALPTVMNTAPAVGLAQPVFYAWLFYPLLGILSAGVGAALAVRLALLTMLAIQFFALLSAGRKVLGQTRLAYTVAVSVIWATYSLTNLYNRGALAEYFATGFFVTAIAFGTSATVAGDRSSRWFYGWLAGFFLILTAGTHPPTAALAAAFLALLACGGMIAGGRATFRAITGRSGMLVAGGLIAGAVILAPWVYASGLFASKLSLAGTARDFIFRPENCDSFWGRFAPFPYDAAAMENGIYGLGTAYLEAPINVVLLGILLWNLELCRRTRNDPPLSGTTPFGARAILVFACGWFLFLAAVSVSPSFAGCFRFAAPYIQYAYRLVSHCNAALLVAVFASGAWVTRHAGFRRHPYQTDVVVAVCLTVAVLGLWIKMQHAGVAIAAEGDRPASVARRQREVAPGYTLVSVPELPGSQLRGAAALTFPVARDPAHFGETGAVKVELKQAGWVRTNAVFFPWTEIWVDGKMARADQLARDDAFLVVTLPAGPHEVRAVWQPDRTWSVLNRLSQAVFALALLVTLAWGAARLRSGRGAVTPT